MRAHNGMKLRAHLGGGASASNAGEAQAGFPRQRATAEKAGSAQRALWHEKRRCPLRSGSIALATVLLAAAILAGGALSQIYQWTDENGDRHFTSSLESIPEPQRSKAKLVVEPRPTPARQEASPAAPPRREALPPPQPPPPERTAQAGEFEAGWVEGFHAAMEQASALCAARPPAVIQQPPPLSPAPFYDPSGLYYRPPYQGMVTVPFDQGRTRGLTRRQQIQDRRQIGP